MSRRSNRSELPGAALAIVFFAGCAGASPGLPRSDVRHPDGVAIDPIATPPEPVEVAHASSGVVALTTPLGSDAARTTVRTFFEAVSREDIDALRGTLSPDAISINPATRGRDRIEYAFMRRFQRFEYFSLASVPFWQDDAMEVYRASEARDLWSDALGPAAMTTQIAAPHVGDGIDAGDVVIRIATSAPRAGSVPLLGDSLTFLLVRVDGRYVIHRLVEEFQLP